MARNKAASGLELAIGDLRLCDRLIFEDPETECWLNYHFHFSGEHENKYTFYILEDKTFISSVKILPFPT